MCNQDITENLILTDSLGAASFCDALGCVARGVTIGELVGVARVYAGTRDDSRRGDKHRLAAWLH